VIALVATTISGDVVYVSDVYENQNEDFILEKCGLRNLLKNSQDGVIADAGITFNTAENEQDNDLITAAWTLGPMSLNRSKILISGILKKLCNNEKPIDAALGKLLEAIGTEIGNVLHNSSLAASARVVVEDYFSDLRKWNYFASRNRSYHLMHKHQSTLLLNDMLKAFSYIYRRMKLIRGYYLRAVDWHSKKENENPFIEMPNIRNAKVWQFRIKKFVGEDSKNPLLLRVETGSDLFKKLWQSYFNDEKNSNWQELEKQRYAPSNEFSERFKKYLQLTEEQLNIERELQCEGGGNGDNDDEEADLDMGVEDEFGFLRGALQHKRKQRSVFEQHPELYVVHGLSETSPEEELKKLSLAELAKILVHYPQDIENGRVGSLYAMATTALSEDLFSKATYAQLLKSVKDSLMNLTKNNCQKVVKDKLNNIKAEMNGDDQGKHKLREFLESVVNTYTALNLEQDDTK
jgi:hypothetical protein